MAVAARPAVAVPAAPYRGIRPFRYVDHAIFFARDEETRQLESLVAVYRGVMLYGDSGAGKSSLVNAGLLPRLATGGFEAERVRVQPRDGEELVVERILVSDDEGGYLPSAFADAEDEAPRVVLSVAAFEDAVTQAAGSGRLVIVFDQFEELLTLFEDSPDAQRRIVELIVRLLRAQLPVKLLFAFREDYLGRVKELLTARPELVDQSLRLAPPTAAALPTIIRGPFERFPGGFGREISAALADRLCDVLSERFGSGEVSLSEVETVCLRLWHADDPEALLRERDVQGILEDYLGEALDAFPPDLRGAAIAVLAQMVTSAGTRNILAADEVVDRAHEEEGIPRELLGEALVRLEQESRLVRAERRHELLLYTVTSEFLLPWINRRREEFERAQAARRDRKRLLVAAGIVAVLALVVAVVAGLAVWALHQKHDADQAKDEAKLQARTATSLALDVAARGQLDRRIDAALMLDIAAYGISPRPEIRANLVDALQRAHSGGSTGVLHGSVGGIATVAFSPDGHTVAAAGDDRLVRLWDLRSHRTIAPALAGAHARVTALAFSHDGRTIAATGDDGRVRIWDVQSHSSKGNVDGCADAEGPVAVAFGDEDRTLRCVGARGVRAWDVHSRRPVGRRQKACPTDSTAVAFSGDGRTAACTDDFTVRVVDSRSHRRKRAPFNSDDIAFNAALAISPDGRRVAVEDVDGNIELWDVGADATRPKPIVTHMPSIVGLAFGPGGHLLAGTADDGTVRVWSVRSRRRLGPVRRGAGDAGTGLAFSPNGRTLVFGATDGAVRVFDLRSGAPVIPEVSECNGALLAGGLRFSADGRTLTCQGAATVRVDLESRRIVARSRPACFGITYFGAISANGQTVACGTLAQTVLSATASGRSVVIRWCASVFDVALSPDGRLVACSSPRGLQVGDTRTGRIISRASKCGRAYSIAFRPDGRMLACSARGTIYLADTGLRRIAGIRAGATAVDRLAFSPDGRTLASHAGRTTQLWDVRSRKPVGASMHGTRDIFGTMAFSRKGRTLATADGRSVRLWDVRSGTQLGHAIPTRLDSVRSIAFSPDDRAVAAVGRLGTAILPTRLWTDMRDLAAQVCSFVGTGLSRDEWRAMNTGLRYQPNPCR